MGVKGAELQNMEDREGQFQNVMPIFNEVHKTSGVTRELIKKRFDNKVILKQPGYGV